MQPLNAIVLRHLKTTCNEKLHRIVAQDYIINDLRGSNFLGEHSPRPESCHQRKLGYCVLVEEQVPNCDHSS